MDPNALLARLLDALQTINDEAERSGPFYELRQEDTIEATEAAQELIDWLNQGGFPPNPERVINAR